MSNSSVLSRGTINFIVGPSGSGKTTLIDTVAGLWGKYQGFKDLRPVYVAQNTRVTLKTVLRLRSLMLQKNSQSAILIDNANLLEIFHVLSPISFIDHRTLSGGEIQRIAILDSLSKNANIYYFDEITSGLDLEMAEKVISILKKLASEFLVLAITHNEELISSSDNVIRVNGGNIKF